MYFTEEKKLQPTIDLKYTHILLGGLMISESILMNFYKIAGITGMLFGFLFIFYKLIEKMVNDISISLKQSFEHMVKQIEEDSKKQYEQIKRDSENNQRNLEKYH